MAEEQKRRPGSQGSPHHNIKRADSRNGSQTHDARKQPPSTGQRQTSRNPDHRKQDAVPEVECGKQEVGARCHAPASFSRRGAEPAHRGEGAHQTRSGHQIPCVEAALARTTRSGSSSVHTGARASQRGGGQNAQQTQNPLQSFRMGARVRSAERANAATARPGGGATEDHQQRHRPGTPCGDILRCCLENRSNTCYINASIISIYWQMTMANCEEALPSAWQQQLRAQKWYPRSFLRLHLMAWRQSEAQHDVAEF